MGLNSNLTIQKLNEKIEVLEKYYEKYPNKTRVEELNKTNNYLQNQEYKIAVVANMSSGKSTFINALFGREVLPAFNHATTDSATYIYSKLDTEKKAKIFFNDGKEAVEIIDKLEEEIKQYAQKDDECESDKYKNVEMIELHYPFKNLQTSSSEDFRITFIDTPGPNSTGETYKQKHKDQTRKVLNEVDLALFMFDYTQLDANLSSDEQGLWNTIKKRHDKDKNFDIYFLLNKIDYALDDNFKEIDTKDKDEFLKQKKEAWSKFENISINKLKNAAIKHGVNNPKVYPISSKYQLLHRDNDKNWDEEDDLDNFQKSHFKRLFKNEWEKKYIDYMGVLKLENNINDYINTSVKDKILLKTNFMIESLYSEEKEDLQQRIQVLQKPKDEAERNLKDANEFLKTRANELEEEFREESFEIQKKYIELIKKVINDNIEKELKKNTNEATNRTIKFLELLLEDYSVSDATSDAKNLPSQQIKDNLSKKNIRITVSREFEVDEIEKNLQDFIVSILNDYKNNYLDMKIDIKNNYFELSEKLEEIFNKFKLEFNKKLKNTLKINEITLDENSLYISSSFDDNIVVPDSTIEYKYQSAEWSRGGSFSSREKIRDEKHNIIISPSNIKEIFNLSIESIKRSYLNQEIKTYEDNIVNFIKFYQNKFNDFKQIKKQEIKQIEKDLESSKENLEIISAQYDEFNKIQKEI